MIRKILRKITIVQRVGIVTTILFLLYVMYVHGNRFELRPKMLFPIVLGWGAYWIIIAIIEKWKNK
jgi:hypothetical protein